jgi:transcription termination/antitermination protein NusA
VVVSDDQLSLAIGRRGQNVRLASMLTGWDIDILTEQEESDRRSDEIQNRSGVFMQALDVDDVIAHLLVAEGFSSVEEIAYVETEELAEIQGFDESVADELKQRALAFLDEQESQANERRLELGVEDVVAELTGCTAAQLVKLGENGVKTLDDLADLAGDELVEILGKDGPSEEEANEIIMAARAHWFEGEGAAAGGEAGEQGQGASA